MSLESTVGSRNHNGALSYSVRSPVQPELVQEDDDSLAEFLKSRGREGFAASAYWGATGEVPPREPDDVAKDTFRFGEEINRKLVPLPEDRSSFPRTLDHTVIGTHLVGVTPNGDNGGMNASQLQQLGDGDGATRGKPRFLSPTTTTQRMPHDFDDGVMQALRDANNKEKDMLRQLQTLRTTPFGTGNPDPYRVTSDDYCDFSEMDPASYQVTEAGPGATLGPNGEPLEVYRSRYNNVERNGPQRRERTFQQLQRGRQVDCDGLRASLEGRTQATMPRGWKGHSAKDWMSTTHREHAAYDVDAAATANSHGATVPLRNTNYALTAAHELAVTQHDDRAASRHTGGEDGLYGTEYGDNYLDRFDQANVTKDFVGKSVFDIKFGIYTMDHHAHQPCDIQTGETYTPAELVPGQYTTMLTEPLHARNEVVGSGGTFTSTK